MYYHPRMLDWANDERPWDALQACFDIWLDGVAGPPQGHAEATSRSCAGQLRGLPAGAEPLGCDAARW